MTNNIHLTKQSGRELHPFGLAAIHAAAFDGASEIPLKAPAPHEPSAFGPDGWRAEYAASQELQREFISADNYVAFKKAEAKGLVKLDRRPTYFKPNARIATAADRAEWAREFQETPSITAEFLGSEASYVAYQVARRRGGGGVHRGCGGR